MGAMQLKPPHNVAITPGLILKRGKAETHYHRGEWAKGNVIVAFIPTAHVLQTIVEMGLLVISHPNRGMDNSWQRFQSPGGGGGRRTKKCVSEKECV